MAHEFQNFKSTTLATALAAGASSATLTAANFTDFTDGYLVLDYDNPTKREVIRCTVSGTAVSSVTRGQDGTSDVAHDAGAKVIWALLATHLEELASGWKLANEAWAYASASTITVPTGAASRYSVGDKIKITQTTVKYFYVTAVADTVLTVTGGTDYTVANAAISANYYSKMASPVGFPPNSNTFGPLGADYKAITSPVLITAIDTVTDVPNLAITVTVPTGARIKLSAFTSQFYSDNAAGVLHQFMIREGSSAITNSLKHNTGANYSLPMYCSIVISPTAGSHTYKVSVYQGSAGNMYVGAETDRPAYLMAEIV
jgi:hypothetical protein